MPAQLRTRTATVVLNGDDVFEDLFTAAGELQTLLTEEGFAVRTGTGTARFEPAESAEPAEPAKSAESAEPAADETALGDDLIVLYTAAGRFTAAQRRGLARAVRDGAGLIALHSTTVPATETTETTETAAAAAAAETAAAEDPGGTDDPLLELIGSRYTGHGPPPHESRFRVQLDGSHELTAGIAPFDVTHEHYRIEAAGDVRVLAWRAAADAAAEPLVHVRGHGDGRVCYVQFGHDRRIWGEPSVRQLVRQAARWACRRAARGV